MLSSFFSLLLVAPWGSAALSASGRAPVSLPLAQPPGVFFTSAKSGPRIPSAPFFDLRHSSTSALTLCLGTSSGSSCSGLRSLLSLPLPPTPLSQPAQALVALSLLLFSCPCCLLHRAACFSTGPRRRAGDCRRQLSLGERRRLHAQQRCPLRQHGRRGGGQGRAQGQMQLAARACILERP